MDQECVNPAKEISDYLGNGITQAKCLLENRDMPVVATNPLFFLFEQPSMIEALVPFEVFYHSYYFISYILLILLIGVPPLSCFYGSKLEFF